MKVLFLVSKLNNPSTRYRVQQYRPFLAAEGISSRVLSVSESLRGRLGIWWILRQFDIVFIQRRLFQPWEFSVLRWFSRRLVFDLDDAVMFKSHSPKPHANFTRQLKFRSMARGSDLVIAGNHYLKEQVLPFNARVEIVPTPVDMRRYLPKIYQESERVTLGWIGSRSTLRYLKNVKDVLEAIGSRYPQVQLKIVADHFFECQNLPVIKKRWDFASEIEDLHSFDIGLMPLPDDAWACGKCGFKLIQYMAVGVPVICSPVGMNREIVNPGTNGLWAADAEQWEACLSALVEAPALRRELGVEGIKTVRARYSLAVHAPRLARYLRELGEG